MAATVSYLQMSCDRETNLPLPRRFLCISSKERTKYYVRLWIHSMGRGRLTKHVAPLEGLCTTGCPWNNEDKLLRKSKSHTRLSAIMNARCNKS